MQRDRPRRQRGRAPTRGRAELSFDFYDDWDDDENDGLLGWGNDEFDRLVAGSGAHSHGHSHGHGGYGTADAQPAKQRGMAYPKTRRKSLVDGEDPTVSLGSRGGFLRRLFGGKDLRYRPSAADLQEHPGARTTTMTTRNRTEGEALLEDDELGVGRGRGKGRARSGTQGSQNTTSSYSSRGDIFPSDEEDDAIPLDDEFAMVLERRTTLPGTETESSSGKTAPSKRGKRPSAGSRTSTRTFSSRSARSERGSKKRKIRTSSYAQTPESEAVAGPMHERTPSYADLKREEAQIAAEEEADVLRRRRSAQQLAEDRGLVNENPSSKEATPRSTTPAPKTTTTEMAATLDDQVQNPASSIPPHVEGETQNPPSGD